MKAISVEKFVETWLNAPNRGDAWYWTRVGLEQRYDPVLMVSGGRLASEEEWVRALLAEMRGRAAAETGFKRFRIERAIPRIELPNATAEDDVGSAIG